MKQTLYWIDDDGKQHCVTGDCHAINLLFDILRFVLRQQRRTANYQPFIKKIQVAVVEDFNSLLEEWKVIQHSPYITPAQHRRAREISKKLNQCICRTCDKIYDKSKSRSDYTGFCSAKCQHQKAKDLGFKKNSGLSEYNVLNSAHQVGNVLVTAIE